MCIAQSDTDSGSCTHLDLLPVGDNVRGAHNNVVDRVEGAVGGSLGQVEGVAAHAQYAELSILQQHMNKFRQC